MPTLFAANPSTFRQGPGQGVCANGDHCASNHSWGHHNREGERHTSLSCAFRMKTGQLYCSLLHANEVRKQATVQIYFLVSAYYASTVTQTLRFLDRFGSLLGHSCKSILFLFIARFVTLDASELS